MLVSVVGESHVRCVDQSGRLMAKALLVKPMMHSKSKVTSKTAVIVLWMKTLMAMALKLTVNMKTGCQVWVQALDSSPRIVLPMANPLEQVHSLEGSCRPS